MEPGFEALLTILGEPLAHDRSVRTDNSVLLIYPPERELDFRERLTDTVIPSVAANGPTFRVLDLGSFISEELDQTELEALQEAEFEDYRWMKQGLSRRLEDGLCRRLTELSAETAGGVVFLLATASLFPLVRFGELLRRLRDLDCRIVVPFPGEERGGKLHFMGRPDGGNYLAIRLHVWPHE